MLWRYPLSVWPLALALGIYAGVLWRWPAVWLVVVPAVLPAFDLAPWTGWLYVGESDLFMLVTLGVLLIRSPLDRADLAFGRLAVAAILLPCAVYLVSIVIGLWSMPAETTANPYLSTSNGLRIAKGFFAALALFPFLARQIRRDTRALVWLGTGMISGLTLVAAAIIAERYAFVGLLDFSTDYRVVGTFSSMHLGGGLVGAYLAMAVPFLLLFTLAPRWALPLGSVVAMAALYALVVTYARTAYAVGVIAILAACVAWMFAARCATSRRSGFVVPAALVLVFAAGLGTIVVESPFMSARVAQVTGDLATRERGWSGGMGVRDDGIATMLLGAGLGTYPRIFRERAAGQRVGSNFSIAGDAERRWLAITAGAPFFYFGQKVPVTAPGDYVIAFAWRSGSEGGTIGVILCEKLLLYSDNCSGADFKARKPGAWSPETATLRVDRLAPAGLFGWLRRPVEMSFHVSKPGETVEIRDVRLLGPDQQPLLRNGDFARGTDRWFFTDDDHLVWRMKSQFLMVLFEQGVLGLASYLLLIGAALLGLGRAIVGGDRAAAPVVGAIVAYFCAGSFDYLIEAPRLSSLFYLLCFAGLAAPAAGIQAAPGTTAPLPRLGA